MKINSFSYWDLNIIYRGPQSQQPMLFILYMGTLIFVSVHIILTVPMPCLFGEAKLC